MFSQWGHHRCLLDPECPCGKKEADPFSNFTYIKQHLEAWICLRNNFSVAFSFLEPETSIWILLGKKAETLVFPEARLPWASGPRLFIPSGSPQNMRVSFQTGPQQAFMLKQKLEEWDVVNSLKTQKFQNP